MNLLSKTIQGKTIQYTRMGLGLAALGRPGYINLGHAEDLPAERTQEAMMLHAMSVLDAAWAAGVRYFDVARSYGSGELFLNTWLRIRNIPPDQVTIGSKWGYTYTANWQVHADQHEVKDHSLATLRRQIGESAHLLGPWLKLYQIHSATLESGVLDRHDVLDELARLRDGGLLIGLSVSGIQQGKVIEKALGIQRGGMPVFGSVQATWNLLEPSAGPMLAEAHQAGWLVIVKEGLANGRLTNRGQELLPEKQIHHRRTDQPLDVLALAAVLRQPWADIVLSGACTVTQLQSNCLAANYLDELNGLDHIYEISETPNQYWQKRSKLEWQ